MFQSTCMECQRLNEILIMHRVFFVCRFTTRDQQIEVHLKCTKRALWFICRCLQTNFYIYFFLFWLDYLFTIFRISFAFITDPIHTLIKIILCNHVTKTAWYFPFFFSSTAMFEYNSTIAIENIEQKKLLLNEKKTFDDLYICFFLSGHFKPFRCVVDGPQPIPDKCAQHTAFRL